MSQTVLVENHQIYGTDMFMTLPFLDGLCVKLYYGDR